MAEEQDNAPTLFIKQCVWSFVDSIQDIVEVKDELRREGEIRDDIFEAVILPSLALLELHVGKEISFGKTNESNLYIIEEGKVGLKIKGAASVGQGQSSQFYQEFGKGATFGELGVLFGISRISSLKCLEASKIWCMDRETFSVIFLHGADDHMVSPTRQPPSRRRIKSMKAFLKVKEVLGLPFEKLQRLVLQLQVTTFERDNSLYVEGRCSTRLMLIEKGFVDVVVPPSSLLLEKAGESEAKQREILMKMGIIGSVIRSQKMVRNSFCDEDEDAMRSAMDPNSSDGRGGTAGLGAVAGGGGSFVGAELNEVVVAKSISLIASAASRFAKNKKQHTIRFGEGTLLGVGVIASKFQAPGAWPWKDEIIDGVPSVGAVSPVTVVASSKKVEVIYLTTHVFENLFGPASSMYLFPSFLQKALDAGPKSARAGVIGGVGGVGGVFPDGVGDLVTPSFYASGGDEEEEEEQNVDPTTNGYSSEYFESIEVISRNPLGNIVRAGKRMRKESVETLMLGKIGAAAGAIKRPYILKVYSKAVIIRQRQTQRALSEAEILSHLNHPFIMKLAGRFQTRDDLVLVLENAATAGAGDLWGLMHADIKGFERTRIVPGRRDPLISLDAVRFYTASLVLALSHLHRHDIAYRNLRPENVLIDARGFIRLISFGNAKEVPFINTSGVEQTKTSTLCGDTEYMAPEMVAGSGHDKMVDIWALGALLHHMLTGESPFARYGQVLVGAERQWLPDADLRIMAKIATLASKEGKLVAIPRQFRGEKTVEGADEIMLQFLSLDPSERPCTKHDIKQADFFYHVDWRSLRDRSVAPPFIPPLEGMGESSKAEQARSRLLKLFSSPGLSNSHANAVKANMVEGNDDYRYDDPDDQDEYRDALTDVELRVDAGFLAQAAYARLKLRERGVSFFGRSDEPKLPGAKGKKGGLVGGALKTAAGKASTSKLYKAVTMVATLNMLSAPPPPGSIVATKGSDGSSTAAISGSGTGASAAFPPDSARSSQSNESSSEPPAPPPSISMISNTPHSGVPQQALHSSQSFRGGKFAGKNFGDDGENSSAQRAAAALSSSSSEKGEVADPSTPHHPPRSGKGTTNSSRSLSSGNNHTATASVKETTSNVIKVSKAASSSSLVVSSDYHKKNNNPEDRSTSIAKLLIKKPTSVKAQQLIDSPMKRTVSTSDLPASEHPASSSSSSTRPPLVPLVRKPRSVSSGTYHGMMGGGTGVGVVGASSSGAAAPGGSTHTSSITNENEKALRESIRAQSRLLQRASADSRLPIRGAAPTMLRAQSEKSPSSSSLTASNNKQVKLIPLTPVSASASAPSSTRTVAARPSAAATGTGTAGTASSSSGGGVGVGDISVSDETYVSSSNGDYMTTNGTGRVSARSAVGGGGGGGRQYTRATVAAKPPIAPKPSPAAANTTTSTAAIALAPSSSTVLPDGHRKTSTKGGASTSTTTSGNISSTKDSAPSLPPPLNAVASSRTGKRRDSVANEFLDRLFQRKTSSNLAGGDSSTTIPLPPLGGSTNPETTTNSCETGAGAGALLAQLQRIEEHEDDDAAAGASTSTDSDTDSETEQENGEKGEEEGKEENKEDKKEEQKQQEISTTPLNNLIIVPHLSSPSSATAATVTNATPAVASTTPAAVTLAPFPVTGTTVPAAAATTATAEAPKAPQSIMTPLIIPPPLTSASSLVIIPMPMATTSIITGSGRSRADSADSIEENDYNDNASEGGSLPSSPAAKSSRFTRGTGGVTDTDDPSSSAASPDSRNSSLIKAAAAAANESSSSSNPCWPSSSILPIKEEPGSSSISINFPHEQFCGAQSIFKKFAGFTTAFPASVMDGSKRGGAGGSFLTPGSGASSLPSSEPASPRRTTDSTKNALAELNCNDDLE